MQPGRGRRAARGRVRVLRPVRRALRQDVGIEGVVCRQVEDGHRVVDPRLREREGALAREALRGLGRIRRRVRGCGRPNDEQHRAHSDRYHERDPALGPHLHASPQPHGHTIGMRSAARVPRTVTSPF